jgi:peptide/nickel transport system substrate-binding protein
MRSIFEKERSKKIMKNKKEDAAVLTRRDFLFLSGLGMAGMTLSGLPELGHGAEKPKYGGRLRVGERRASPGLDAHRNQTTQDSFNYLLLYNGLTQMGPVPPALMYPDLAKSWEISQDGREYTFLLREGVKFHHGKELNSGDVKYSIERVMNPATRSPRAFAFKWVDSVHVIDKYHVKIRLKVPFGPFLTSLTIRNCPIIPSDWEPTGTKPAPGTGPFVFKSFVPNETLEVTRFDQYWEYDEKTGDRLPYLESMYIKKIVDEAVRWTALRAGDLDYINGLPRNIALQELKQPTPGIVVLAGKGLGFQAIWFNVQKPPFNNKKVRQAFAYAIDKKELVNAAQWGFGEIINNQPFLPGSPMYVPVKDREVDFLKAKQLLAEAGYPNGFKTEFLLRSTFWDVASCEVAIGQLKKIGIEGTMKVIDYAPYVIISRKGEFNITLTSEDIRLDPDDGYYPFLHSDEINMNNYSRYSNKEVDKLLEEGRTKWKLEDRMTAYKKVVEMIKEDLPLIYLNTMKTPLAFRGYVKGFEGGAGVWFGYYGGGMRYVWLDK